MGWYQSPRVSPGWRCQLGWKGSGRWPLLLATHPRCGGQWAGGFMCGAHRLPLGPHRAACSAGERSPSAPFLQASFLLPEAQPALPSRRSSMRARGAERPAFSGHDSLPVSPELEIASSVDAGPVLGAPSPAASQKSLQPTLLQAWAPTIVCVQLDTRPAQGPIPCWPRCGSTR